MAYTWSINGKTYGYDTVCVRCKKTLGNHYYTREARDYRGDLACHLNDHMRSADESQLFAVWPQRIVLPAGV